MSVSTCLTQLFSVVQDFRVINITHLVITQAAFFKYMRGEVGTQWHSPSTVCLLLILQSFDWLAAFRPELLQAILFIAA
jgi:hypothetical protein